MKVLYFGTLCEQTEYERTVSKAKKRPSVASMVFESALMEGMSRHGVDIDIFSFPMIPTVLNSGVLFWGRKRDILPCGYHATWITTLNVSGLKQISRAVSSYRMLKRWLREHHNERCAVVIYSVCPYIAPNIIKLCSKYHVKCFAIIPDLPSNMFINHVFGRMKMLLTKLYLAPAIKYQRLFDGYVYLTHYMKEAVSATAPNVIVEGIADTDQFNDILAEKSEKRSIMYAGRLHEKYGLRNLIEAYLSIPHKSMELWLFGSGSFEKEICSYAQRDTSIRFWGQVDRQTILEYERRATLLVNCRSAMDDYAKYSFPSKTIEYMLSGTPVLTTKLLGIPEEYREYLYMIDTNEVKDIAYALESIFSKSDEELESKGKCSREFIIHKKNAEFQAGKILNLMDAVIRDDE